MDYIINQLLHSFDFGLISIINVFTFLIIKLFDELNKEKIVGTWQKRIIFVIVSIVIGIIYRTTSDVQIYIIVNSIIVSPVAWSWLAKPIANKLGIDYKKEIDLFK